MPQVIASDVDDLEIVDDFTPSTVFIDHGPLGLELDRALVHLLGAIEHHLAVVPGRLDGGQGPVVEEAGALVLDDPAGDLGVAHREHLHDDPELSLVIGVHQTFHRQRRIVETVGALCELVVALEPGPLGLRGVDDRLARPDHIDQAHERHLVARLGEQLRGAVRECAAERPSDQDVRPFRLHLFELRVVLLDAFFDGAFDTVEPDDGHVGRKPFEQSFVRSGRTTGRVEHQYRRPIGVLRCPQVADEPIDETALEVLAHVVRHRLDVVGVDDVLDVESRHPPARRAGRSASPPSRRRVPAGD